MDYQKYNQVIYTKDILVTSPYDEEKDSEVGEYDDFLAEKGSPVERLFLLIEKLVKKTAKIHRHDNYYQPELATMLRGARYQDTAFKQGYENNITRLVTNEFMFYTKERLEPKEFGILIEKPLILASKQPDNLHLILSTFAVRALNDKTLNVAVFLQCGEIPKVNFIVKNLSSDIDPIYYGKSKDHKSRINFDNIEIEKDDEEQFPVIDVQGIEYKFSYNNIFEVSTLGGAIKLEVIEICLDNHEGVGKENFEVYMDTSLLLSENLLPTQISHVVTSNTISLRKKNMLELKATHADPKYSRDTLIRHDRMILEKTIKSDLYFGTPNLNFVIAKPKKCKKLPFNYFPDAEEHNEKIINNLKRKREAPPLQANKKPKL